MKTKNKVKDKPETKVFLWDARFASGDIATDEQYYKAYDLFSRRHPRKKLNEEESILFEVSITRCALEILRYSHSEWGNDYYDWVEGFGMFYNWLDKYSKIHKIGKYFKL